MSFIPYPSVLVLMVANLVPLMFVLTGRWDVYQLLLGYWWEGLIMSGLAVIKLGIVRSQAPQQVQDEFDTFDIPVLAYSLMVTVLSLVDLWVISALAVRFDGSLTSVRDIFSAGLTEVMHWAGTHLLQGSIVIWLIAVLISHAFSWYSNFLVRKEYARQQNLLEHALSRIIAPQAVAFALGLISVSIVWLPLWVVVAGKTLVDAAVHLIERLSANPREISDTTGEPV